ncbi:MAG TPA: 2-dehydropantoate 2-reductase [Eubacteriaceae bacterium]|nr:2-dehydropantoate 2-reductase [Eubacteriaceae bacterium]
MTIKKVSIIGLGALGTMYAKHILDYGADYVDLRVIADGDRIKRYQKNGVYANGEKCEFAYIRPEEKEEPSDLILFSVKYHGLKQAIEDVKNQVGENTIFLSTLNGIVSEQDIARRYGKKNMVYCVAQGMDAVKLGYSLQFKNKGILSFGTYDEGDDPTKADKVEEFFKQIQMPYERNDQMKRKLWSKFMINVGVNQATAVYGVDYEGIQKEGEPRNKMIEAMKEVLLLSQKEEVGLTDHDLYYWLNIMDGLNPEGMPSMRQDILEKRKTEVGLFSETVLQFARKHGVKTPVNQMFYDQIKDIEKNY